MCAFNFEWQAEWPGPCHREKWCFLSTENASTPCPTDAFLWGGRTAEKSLFSHAPFSESGRFFVLSLVRRCSPHCAAKALNRVSFMTKKGRFEYQILFCPFLSFVHATRLPKIGLTSRDIADILSRIERKICAWQGKTTFALLQLTIEKARDCWRWMFCAAYVVERSRSTGSGSFP